MGKIDDFPEMLGGCRNSITFITKTENRLKAFKNQPDRRKASSLQFHYQFITGKELKNITFITFKK
jgi:hypothetical protein